MDTTQFFAEATLFTIIAGILVIALVCSLLWAVIRSAVLSALRTHQKDLDKRTSADKPYVPLA